MLKKTLPFHVLVPAGLRRPHLEQRFPLVVDAYISNVDHVFDDGHGRFLVLLGDDSGGCGCGAVLAPGVCAAAGVFGVVVGRLGVVGGGGLAGGAAPGARGVSRILMKCFFATYMYYEYLVF